MKFTLEFLGPSATEVFELSSEQIRLFGGITLREKATGKIVVFDKTVNYLVWSRNPFGGLRSDAAMVFWYGTNTDRYFVFDFHLYERVWMIESAFYNQNDMYLNNLDKFQGYSKPWGITHAGHVGKELSFDVKEFKREEAECI